MGSEYQNRLFILFAVAFGIRLARARVVGWWFPATSLAALVIHILTSDASDHLVVLAGFVPLGATWLALVWLLWTPSPAVLLAAAPLGASWLDPAAGH